VEINKIKDERIQRGIAQNTAPMYKVLLILTTLSLIIKIALKLHPILYTVEIIALITSLFYYVITTTHKKVLLTKETDEAITNIKNLAKNNSYQLHFWIFIFGQMILCILILIYPFYILNPKESGPSIIIPGLSLIVYIFIGVIPLSYASKKSHKQGLLVAWNSEKSKTTTLKKLKLYFTIQAICSGTLVVVLCLLAILGYFPPKPFNLVFPSSVAVFILSFMYFNIKKGMLESEKIANKEAELAEKLTEGDGYEE